MTLVNFQIQMHVLAVMVVKVIMNASVNSPYILLQLWGFVAMEKNYLEKKYWEWEINKPVENAHWRGFLWDTEEIKEIIVCTIFNLY